MMIFKAPLYKASAAGLLIVVSAWEMPATAATNRQFYPLSPESPCGSTQSCAQVLERWNGASWTDLVDEGFNTGSLNLAAVRWYTTEFPCSGTKCNDQLHSGGGSCPVLSVTNSQFCGVTDELGNVLLSLSMGSNQAKYDKLHSFTELLRHPSVNYLQCWKYYVNGRKVYDDYTDLCVTSDSASDASIRILGAYGIACAKQRSGLWSVNGMDYCADYLQQGNAIWGLGTVSHGEIKQLANGQAFLANGYNNQAGAPASAQSFRPDYYELQFLMDFAEYLDDPALVQDVLDMLTDYSLAMGDNHIHRGKTGHFDAATTVYFCDDLCAPPYMDNIDTWRAVPALSGLINVHPEVVPTGLKSSIFDYWWQQYAGGHPSLYGPATSKPFEIFSNSANGTVKYSEESYKTLGMWTPLGAANEGEYTVEAIHHLVDQKYDAANEQFYGAAYYGGYFSQFAQRALGAATGMIDPAFWLRRGAGTDFYTLTPCRVLDTRNGAPLLSGVPQAFAVAGTCGVPATARSVSLNVTVVGPTSSGIVTLYPEDLPVPGTSTVSFTVDLTRGNNTLIALATNGSGMIGALASLSGGGEVDLLLDVNGYFE